MLQPAAKPAQRFFNIIASLNIGLETTVLKEEVSKLQQASSLPEGFSVRDPNAYGDKPKALTVGLTHPALNNGVDLATDVFFPVSIDSKPLIITFGKLPDNLPVLFQRINLEQDLREKDVLGLICGRFGESEPFIIRHRNETNPRNPKRHVNLDCLSKSPIWNPLYVKYHLDTPLKNLKLEYLRIDVQKNETNNIVVTVSRVSGQEVPDFLRTALTDPK